jgi:ferric-dicitrate binding protein FerR (iron transport regulator)
LSHNTVELRSNCLAKAQSAEGRRFKAADEEIRLAYEKLAKCWAKLAVSIPAMDQQQPQ